MHFSLAHSMKNFEEVNSNTEIELDKASENRKNKDYENDCQQYYAQTDECNRTLSKSMGACTHCTNLTRPLHNAW